MGREHVDGGPLTRAFLQTILRVTSYSAFARRTNCFLTRMHRRTTSGVIFGIIPLVSVRSRRCVVPLTAWRTAHIFGGSTFLARRLAEMSAWMSLGAFCSPAALAMRSNSAKDRCGAIAKLGDACLGVASARSYVASWAIRIIETGW